MNFFFGIKSDNLDSKLTIPRFQNSLRKNKKCNLYQLKIINQSWEINHLSDVESLGDFYNIESTFIENNSIYCLATNEETQKLNNINSPRLIEFNDFTDTSPSYRANLQVFIKGGGFSSYQSEYPFSMATKKGSILSPLSSLLNKEADKNILFLKNIYEFPIEEEFRVFFVNIRTKQILKKEIVVTNFLNEISIDQKFIEPDIFLFTDKYIGIPIFCSIQNNHISLEHTHPPHEYIMNENKFKVISKLKKEFSEIIS